MRRAPYLIKGSRLVEGSRPAGLAHDGFGVAAAPIAATRPVAPAPPCRPCAPEQEPRKTPKRQRCGLPHEIVGEILDDHSAHQRHARCAQPGHHMPQPPETPDQREQQRRLQHHADNPRLQPGIQKQVMRMRQRLRLLLQQRRRNLALKHPSRQRLAKTNARPRMRFTFLAVKRPQFGTRIGRHDIANTGQHLRHIHLVCAQLQFPRSGFRHGMAVTQPGAQFKCADGSHADHDNAHAREQQMLAVQRITRDHERDGRSRPEEPVERRQADHQGKHQPAQADRPPAAVQHQAGKERHRKDDKRARMANAVVIVEQDIGGIRGRLQTAPVVQAAGGEQHAGHPVDQHDPLGLRNPCTHQPEREERHQRIQHFVEPGVHAVTRIRRPRDGRKRPGTPRSDRPQQRPVQRRRPFRRTSRGDRTDTHQPQRQVFERRHVGEHRDKHNHGTRHPQDAFHLHTRLRHCTPGRTACKLLQTASSEINPMQSAWSPRHATHVDALRSQRRAQATCRLKIFGSSRHGMSAIVTGMNGASLQ